MNVSAIWLRKAKNKDFPSVDDVIVSIEVDGKFYEAIVEIADNNFDHCVELDNNVLGIDLLIDNILTKD